MKTYVTDQWDRTIAAMPKMGFYFRQVPDLGPTSYVALGQIQRPTRLALPGDVLMAVINNGGAERCLVFGVSSRGYLIRNLYMQFQRFRFTKRPAPPGYEQRFDDTTPLRLIELPGDLHGRRVDDPDVRRYVVETLRAGHAARPVGASEPAPLKET